MIINKPIIIEITLSIFQTINILAILVQFSSMVIHQTYKHHNLNSQFHKIKHRLIHFYSLHFNSNRRLKTTINKPVLTKNKTKHLSYSSLNKQFKVTYFNKTLS